MSASISGRPGVFPPPETRELLCKCALLLSPSLVLLIISPCSFFLLFKLILGIECGTLDAGSIRSREKSTLNSSSCEVWDTSAPFLSNTVFSLWLKLRTLGVYFNCRALSLCINEEEILFSLLPYFMVSSASSSSPNPSIGVLVTTDNFFSRACCGFLLEFLCRSMMISRLRSVWSNCPGISSLEFFS